MWPLQQVSRMVVLLPPMGTEQALRVVGGLGIGVLNEQPEGAVIVFCLSFQAWIQFLVSGNGSSQP